MTTDITPERIAELRRLAKPGRIVRLTDQELLALLDALEEARDEHAECDAVAENREQWGRSWERSYHEACDERDQLRAENERLRAALKDAAAWLSRLQRDYDPNDTEGGASDIARWAALAASPEQVVAYEAAKDDFSEQTGGHRDDIPVSFEDFYGVPAPEVRFGVEPEQEGQ